MSVARPTQFLSRHSFALVLSGEDRICTNMLLVRNTLLLFFCNLFFSYDLRRCFKGSEEDSVYYFALFLKFGCDDVTLSYCQLSRTAAAVIISVTAINIYLVPSFVIVTLRYVCHCCVAMLFQKINAQKSLSFMHICVTPFSHKGACIEGRGRCKGWIEWYFA